MKYTNLIIPIMFIIIHTPLSFAYDNFSFSKLALGDGAGNGGDIIRCEASTENSFKGIYTLDYVLTYQYRNNNKDVDSLVLEDWMKYSELIYSKLKMASPLMAASYLNFLDNTDNYSDETKYRIWRESREPLVDLKDEKFVAKVPTNCHQPEQAVIRIPYRDSIEYFIDVNIQSELIERPLQYSMLMLHEFLRDYTDNISAIRRLVRYMHSKSFHESEKLTRDSFNRLLRKFNISLSHSFSNEYNQETLDKKLIKDLELGNKAYVALWISEGADIRARDKWLKNTLSIAINTQDAKLIELLLDHGSDFSDVDIKHNSSLHYLAMNLTKENYHVLFEVVKRVSNLPINKSKTNIDNKTAYEIAVTKGLPEEVLKYFK